jgi:hypothetical protein
MPKFIDLTGQKFGRWTVLNRTKSTTGKTTWSCRCSCGTTGNVIGRNLKNGRSQSCGCWKSDKEKSGAPKTLVNTYSGAKQRCTCPTDRAYPQYGGRGIEFRLGSYEEFYHLMIETWFEGASLDRTDNDGHYEYGNVRWATQEEQMNNTRVNRLVSFRGQTMTLSRWARLLNVPRATLYWRFYNGWPAPQILKELQNV